MVWSYCKFRMRAARWKYSTQKWCKKLPSGHHPTTLSGYIFATKACINNQKKLVKQQYLLHMSPQYGELRPTSGWDRFVSLGHPCKFNRFRILAALLHGTLVVGISQTLWRWTEGAIYTRQGGHHVGHWPTFLVCYYFISTYLYLPYIARNVMHCLLWRFQRNACVSSTYNIASAFAYYP